MEEKKNKMMKLRVKGKDIVVPINRQKEFLESDERISKSWLQAQGNESSFIDGDKMVNREEYSHGLSWRILKIQSEFVKGHDFLGRFGKSVSIFGSARKGFDEKVYLDAEKIAKKLADDGFDIFTGGGPGIMEAANKGASQSKVGRSVGININLPGSGPTERRNQYITDAESFDFFFSRKVILSFAAQFYIFFPGGFGTLDELFEMLTLIQTGKTSPIPVILVNKEFWSPLVDWIKSVVLEKNNAISKDDLDLFHLVDSAEEAYSYIKECSADYGC